MNRAELDHWFANHILAHEAALTRYLHRVWSNPSDVPDLRQEIYVRIYENAAKSLPTSPKSFLFQSARNLMVDKVRRERVVSIDYTQDLDSLNVLVDELSPEHRLSARQELRRLAVALDELSDDSRNVIWLRRIEGLSQRETAARLGMPEGTVESHLSRGLRALTKAMFGHGPTIEPQDTQGSSRGSEHESERGQRSD